MSKLSSLAVAAAATFVFSAPASAQTADADYDFNWAPLSNAPTVAFAGGALFSIVSGVQHQAGPGDAIRKCYSVDVTQGGQNETGVYETTWISVMQGFGANNGVLGNNIGLTSVQAATDSDLGGDTCLSPWFSAPTNTGGHGVSAAAILGVQAGTAGTPFPGVWQSVFQWTQPSGTTFVAGGNAGPNVIGLDSNGLPLLVNVIYEVQGPLNAGNDTQYYLGTTDENMGLQPVATGTRGTGGVTNGNSLWGSTLTGGVTADASNMVSHSRVFAVDPTSGALTGSTPFWGPTAGTDEFNAFVAFSTPFLWAENNGSLGAGGPDWNIGSGTPSNINVVLKDIKSGGQGTQDILWKSGGGGAAGASFDPSLVVLSPGAQPLQFGYFIWSQTPASTMQQLPGSWDDLGGAAPVKPGSYILGTVSTTREGLQTIPANFDALTNIILGNPGLSQGTNFTSATSPFFDGASNANGAIWEGAFDPVESGLSKLKINGGNAFPIASNPNPARAGQNAFLAAGSVQVRLDPQLGILVEVAEIANALTVTLQ